MKKTILLQIALYMSCHFIQAQDSSTLLVNDTILMEKKIKVEVETNQQTMLTGWLTAISDSSVFISGKSIPFSPSLKSSAGLKEINISRIRIIRVHMQGKGGRGAAVGALIGVLVGIPLGIGAGSASVEITNLTEPNTATATADGGTIVGTMFATAAAGALIGVAAGSMSYKSFRIDGERNHLATLRKYLAKKIYKIAQLEEN